MFVFTASQLHALHEIATSAAGALVAVVPRDGWLHVHLVWPRGDTAQVAVMTPATTVRRLDWRGRPGEPIAPDLVRILRRRPPQE